MTGLCRAIYSRSPFASSSSASRVNAHASLQVRDGDPFGIFQIIWRVQDLFSRVASDVSSPGTWIMNRVFGRISVPYVVATRRLGRAAP